MITYTEAKEFLQLANDQDQTLVENLINYSEAHVKNYCDREFDETSYTGEILERDSFDLSGNPNPVFNRAVRYYEYFTNEYPIKDGSVTIKFKGDTVASSKYFITNSTGRIKVDRAYFDYEEDLTIDYTAGYTDSDTPNDLKLVVLELTKALFRDRGKTKKGKANIKNKKVGDFSVSFLSFTATKQIIDSYKSVLDKYKRIK